MEPKLAGEPGQCDDPDKQSERPDMTNPTSLHRITRSLRVIQSSWVVAIGKTVAVKISLANRTQRPVSDVVN